jgi:hypothetical protein
MLAYSFATPDVTLLCRSRDDVSDALDAYVSGHPDDPYLVDVVIAELRPMHPRGGRVCDPEDFVVDEAGPAPPAEERPALRRSS